MDSMSQGTTSTTASDLGFEPITEPLPCELHVPFGYKKGKTLKIATGMALPREVVHTRQIPTGFIRVSIDEIVEGYEDNEIEIPIPKEGIETLKDSLGTFIMWKRREVILITRTSPPPVSGHGSHHASQPSRADGERPGQSSPTSAAASASNARSAAKEAETMAAGNEWSPTIENLEDVVSTPPQMEPGSNDVPIDVPHHSNDVVRPEPPPEKDDVPSQPLPKKDDALSQPPPKEDVAISQASKDDSLPQTPPMKDVAVSEASKDASLPQPPPKKDVRPPPPAKPYVPVVPRTVTVFDTEPTGSEKEKVQQAISTYMQTWKTSWNPSPQVATKVDHVADPRSLLCYDDEVLGDLTDEDLPTFKLGKQLLPRSCLKNMSWEMKKLHHWYMQAAKEGISMIPVRYGPDIFNDMEPDKVNHMGITFDEIYRAYRLQRLDSTLITLWCMLCSIYQRKTHTHTREFWKLVYLNPQLCYKQPKGSVHCGYYTCIFSQSSSKYLDTIVKETKEEKEQRMKRQRTQKQKEYEMTRRGIIPPDSFSCDWPDMEAPARANAAPEWEALVNPVVSGRCSLQMLKPKNLSKWKVKPKGVLNENGKLLRYGNNNGLAMCGKI
ncbi:hypothetical protein EJB05_54690, partial [Eragrostis curvula]